MPDARFLDARCDLVSEVWLLASSSYFRALKAILVIIMAMKKTKLAIFALVGVLCCISFIEQPSAEAALKTVTQQFYAGMEDFDQQLSQYKTAVEQLNETEASQQNLQKNHIATRLAFKKIEFLFEYNDRMVVRRLINGPPLPSVDESAPWVTILEPKGLQVLDELAFSEHPFTEKELLRSHVTQLQDNFRRNRPFQKITPIQHRFVFEAARYEIIRIFTLGVTGFDTPGSSNALPEAQTALRSIYQALTAYMPLLETKDVKLAKQLQKTFTNALTYLDKNQNFDTFNRLVFLKQYINPLFAQTYRMQRTLQVEFIEDATKMPQAQNYHAENLFDERFLDVSYFANLDPKSMTDQRIELGRMLFFDPIMSSNNQRACASCHHPDKAFTDGMNKSMSIGGEDKIARNAPTIINAVFSERYFYDMREPQLERQVRHVVHDVREFKTDFFEIIDKIKQSAEYSKLFAEAYPEQPEYQISQWSISDALTCYVATRTAFNSPFDKYVRGETSKIDPAVERGFNLFMGKAACGSCHFAPTFNGTVPPYYQETESEVLGIPVSKDTINAFLDPDKGRYASSRGYDETPFYERSFKTVSVRNVTLTAPYMHNGVYDTLEEVVDFYNKGGGRGLGLDVPYQTLPFDSLGLNKQEVRDIVRFMETLTDTTGITQKPTRLPVFKTKPEWNKRKVGGDY